MLYLLWECSQFPPPNMADSMRATAPRSIFGPAKITTGEVIAFPHGRPKDQSDIEGRATIARKRLMSQFGYDREEAQLIVDDFLNGSYGLWETEILGVFR